MTGARCRIPLINAVARKIGGVADDGRIVAVDEDDARRFAAPVVTPFRAAAIVVIRRVVLDAIAGRVQETNTPAAISTRIVRAQGVPAPIHHLNPLHIVRRSDILNRRVRHVVKHHSALG